MTDLPHIQGRVPAWVAQPDGTVTADDILVTADDRGVYLTVGDAVASTTPALAARLADLLAEAGATSRNLASEAMVAHAKQVVNEVGLDIDVDAWLL